MELKEIKGELAWVRTNGTVSDQPVNDRAKLDYYGFEYPWSDRGSVAIVKGNPRTNEVLLLDVSARKYYGKYLLRKMGDERVYDYVYVPKEDMALAESIVENPPDEDTSLSDVMEQHQKKRRDRVDVKSLAGQRGLKVWESSHFEGYWCREAGEFYDLPAGWAVLPRGDAGLTRRVRRGSHWVLLQKQKQYTVEIGTAAPGENIEREFVELGGEQAQRERLEKKMQGAEQREQTMTEKFHASIRRCFPRMPQKDIEETIAYARRRGAVGTAQWLYFHIAGQGEDAFDRAAALAVRAHVRHKYTKYDKILSEPPPGEEDFFVAEKEQRDFARMVVRGDIEDFLYKWR